MRIKRFTASTLKAATDQMREDLGPDAIVLNTRTMPRGNAMGIFGKEMYEVTGAVDDDAPAPKPAARKPQPAKQQSPFTQYLANAQPSPVNSTMEEIKKVAAKYAAQQRERGGAQKTPSSSTVDLSGILDLRNEMESMRGALRDLSDQIRSSKTPDVTGPLRDAFMNLIENDVEHQLASEIIQNVHNSLSPDQRDDAGAVEEVVLQVIASLVKVAGPAKPTKRKTRIIALVGPTGVGKTTTIAKLAAIYKMVERKSVALLSTDTYRIGAIEQLKAFAAIADIPMEVLYRPTEMQVALRAFRSKDVILIDTVGRSHRSKKEIAELGKFVEAAMPDETHLVLSAATSLKTAFEVIAQFKPAKPNRLLFTKLDEATSLGSLLSIVHGHTLPLAYVTTGQTVPDDIAAVDPDRFATMVYQGVTVNA